MDEVLVVPDYTYVTDGDDLSSFLWLYAGQIDGRDGTHTRRVSSLGGHAPLRALRPAEIAAHRVMVSYVARPPRDQMAPILEQTYQAVDRAVGWAGRHGTLVIGLGHGTRDADGPNLYVAMAPLRFFPAHHLHFDRVSAVLGGAAEESIPTLHHEFLLRVARRIRGGALARVDFLSCQLGVGRSRQSLLNSVARAFATPVRGLRGNLRLARLHQGNPVVATVVPVGLDCSAPDGVRPVAPYCVDYTDTIPTDARAWMSASP